MQANKEKGKPTTRKKLFAVGIVILISSLGLMGIFLANIEDGSKGGPIRVACIGDSITEGFGYTNQLLVKLGVNYNVRNFGVRGSTVLLSSDKPYVNQSAFPEAIEYQPNIVVIMLGTNDASPEYYQNIGDFVKDYKTLIDAFQTLPTKPQIWLVKPPPILDNGSGANSANFALGVIPGIEQVANQTGLPTIDVYTAMSNHPEDFQWDGVHPTNLGVKVIVNKIYKAISTNK